MTFEQIKNKLKNYTIGIAGCGGLGSNCAMALTRVGIGKLIICDFDIVSESNLNRQFFFHHQIGQKKVDALKNNLIQINPQLSVDAIDIKICPENILSLFDGCDVIVEAFDRADMKKMLIEKVLSDLPAMPLVSGVGMAGYGKSNLIRLKYSDHLYVCGDGISEVSEENPPLAPRVGITANMQANTVLEILLKKQHENNPK